MLWSTVGITEVSIPFSTDINGLADFVILDVIIIFWSIVVLDSVKD